MAPGVCWMKPATPVLSCSPTPILGNGHFVDGVVPAAEPVQAEPPVSMRYWSRSYPGPDESARCTGTMAVEGRLTPGLSAAMAELFHDLMVPRKIPAKVGPSSFSPPDTPGRL